MYFLVVFSLRGIIKALLDVLEIRRRAKYHKVNNKGLDTVAFVTFLIRKLQQIKNFFQQIKNNTPWLLIYVLMAPSSGILIKLTLEEKILSRLLCVLLSQCRLLPTSTAVYVQNKIGY